MSEKKRTPKRYAINIGVPRVSEKHYGSPFEFSVVRPSFQHFQSFFLSLDGFESPIGIIKRKETTVENLIRLIQNHSDKLISDDLLIITFTGHTFVVDSSDEKLTNSENKDRGWAMYDRIFFHFELRQLLQQFREGVKIIIVTDSCYSDRLEARNYIAQHTNAVYKDLFFSKKEHQEIQTSFQKEIVRSYAIKHAALQLHVPLADLKKRFKDQDLPSIVNNSLISEDQTLALVENVIKAKKEQTENERQWFRKDSNIQDYNKILIRSGKPAEQAIPPSVVMISASGRNDRTPSDLFRGGRSLFSISFEDALEIDRGKTNNLSTLFDDLSFFIQLRTIDYEEKKKPTPTILKKNYTDEMNNRIVPQWHYIEGHQRTNITEFQLTISNK